MLREYNVCVDCIFQAFVIEILHLMNVSSFSSSRQSRELSSSTSSSESSQTWDAKCFLRILLNTVTDETKGLILGSCWRNHWLLFRSKESVFDGGRLTLVTYLTSTS